MGATGVYRMKIALMTDTAILPTRKHSTDAGLDLYADLYSSNIGYIEIFENEYKVVHTGVTVEIPEGFFGWITNKSGSNYLIGGGIVDEGYQGELLVKVINPINELLVINHGDKIAQLLILPCRILGIENVELSEIHQKPTERKDTGGITNFYEDRYTIDKANDFWEWDL